MSAGAGEPRPRAGHVDANTPRAEPGASPGSDAARGVAPDGDARSGPGPRDAAAAAAGRTAPTAQPASVPRPARPARIEERLARRGGAVELLRLPAALYAVAVRLRRAAYDRRLLPRAKLPVPVVSVGNLTAGGTGKTPFAAWLVPELARRGFAPGILSRGYGAREGEPNDEARVLAELCPGVPHVQDADRARGGRALVARGVDVVVLDDGFQHRRLARDLDLVLVDATQPWGLPATGPRAGAAGGPRAVRALLPRGLLREPPSSLARADAIVVTRCDAVPARELDGLDEELAEAAPGVPRVHAGFAARAIRGEDGRAEPLERWRGREVDLASAIGNPRAFEALVRASGLRVGEHRAFPDHHAYVRADLAGLGERRPLLVTHKDAVKLAGLGVRHAVLDAELRVLDGRPLLDALLERLPRPGPPAKRLVAPRSLRG